MGYILVDVIGKVSTQGLFTGRCRRGCDYSQVTYWWMTLGR